MERQRCVWMMTVMKRYWDEEAEQELRMLRRKKGGVDTYSVAEVCLLFAPYLSP